MMKRPITKDIIFTVTLVTGAICARFATAQTNGSVSPLTAGQLLGMRVDDNNGHKAGTIWNLVLDLRTGQLKYAVIASRGTLGVGTTLRLAPPHLLSAATALRGIVAVKVTTETWKHAPVFDPSDLASLAQPGYSQRVSRYFEQSDARVTSRAKDPPPATGYVTGEQPAAHPETLKFASDLIGTRVVNRKKDKIGEISDLLVSFGKPHPAFAIISPGRFFQHQQQYAVSMSALSPTPGSSQLMLNADTAVLQQAPPFNQQAWQGSNTNDRPRFYRY